MGPSLHRRVADAASVIVVHDYRGHRIEIVAQLVAGAWNAGVRSRDITKLLGPATWTYFYLYVILDVFSRYVVGRMVADGESAALAKRLIDETCRRQNIQPGQLSIHADRGSSMSPSQSRSCSRTSA
jgi:putative transposase